MKTAIDRQEVLFTAALALPAAERPAYLANACADDPALRQRVEILLRAHELAGDFLDSPAATRTGADVTAPRRPGVSDEAPDGRIGRYKLRQKIGEGGCGVVYLAEQEKPVHRRVALKVIKLGMDTKEVIARFEAERQALALMDHPNIAKVFDAGATESGRPYFVMELVRGLPITKFCDEQNLSTAARLELFTQVCHAVQHAHQKGIIHRDLKPSNILVTMHDSQPVPKVIDFGIAKATQGRLTDQTVFTAFEQFIGTPAYMSPEQAELSSLDVDTRSDIYSLGVLLYELLTGHTPFDAKDLVKAGLDEIRRRIREEEPQKPSTRLSTMEGDALTVAARRRQTEPPKLLKLVRGDLDWIVMKCLEKDRTRRYETANSLALDVLRHLHDEPVVACPPSTAYRFKKLVSRNKLTFAAVASVATALVVGATIATWQAVRASRAEQTARNEASISRAVNEFLISDLLLQADSRVQADSEVIPNPDLKVREALDRAGQKAGSRFEKLPLTEAAVRTAIGKAYSGIGDSSKASLHFERALELQTRGFGAEHPTTLAVMNNLIGAYRLQGRLAEAATLAQRALAIQQRVFGADHPTTLNAMTHLAGVKLSQGSYVDATAIHVRILEIRKRVLGAEHSDTLSSMSLLSSAYSAQGKSAEAAALAAQVWEIRKRVRGPEHPDTLVALSLLVSAYSQQGRHAEATALGAQGLEIQQRLLGAEHPNTLMAMINLAGAYRKQGWNVETAAFAARTFETLKRVLGADHPYTLSSMINLASAYRFQKKHAEAVALNTQAGEAHKRVYGAEHPNTLWAMGELAGAYRSQGRQAEATALYAQALEIRKHVHGVEHPHTLGAMDVLGSVLSQQQKLTEAETVLQESLSIREKNSPDDWHTFDTRSTLGGVLADQKRFAEAELLLVSGYQGLKAREATIGSVGNVRLRSALERLVRLYTAWGRPEQIAPWQEKLGETKAAMATKRIVPPAKAPATAVSPQRVPIYESIFQFSTLAGTPRPSGTQDGPAPEAQFFPSVHLAIDPTGALVVSESSTHWIRRIKTDGSAQLIAGGKGINGAQDGPALAARFYGPSAMAFDRAGNLYVADLRNHSVRKIDRQGMVTTLAGKAGQSGSADGPATAARFSQPSGLAIDPAGNLFVAERANHTIRQITPEGVVSTLAGRAGTAGAVDDVGPRARFQSPLGLASDEAGNLYVCDEGNHTVRKITPDGRVTTVAGKAGFPGIADGRGVAARFNRPAALALDLAGNLFVSDNRSHTIRHINPAGEVRTLAGRGGEPGYVEGRGDVARFQFPSGIALDRVGNLYLAEANTRVIRKGVPLSTAGH